MAKKVKKQTKKEVEALVDETITTTAPAENIVTPEEIEEQAQLFKFAFVTTLNNIRFAEDLRMDNLVTTIYETIAENEADAITEFCGQCKHLFPITDDEHLTNVLRMIFGDKMTIVSTPINVHSCIKVDL